MSLWKELKRRNVVRVAIAYVVTAWVVIEVSSLILDIFGAAETISKIIVALLALGLPIAIVFAWVFEVTPEGIKRDSEADIASPSTNQRARRLNILTIGMVMLAIMLLAADRFIGRPASSTVPPDATAAEASSATESTSTKTAPGEPVRDAAWAARQVIEVRRLVDLGKDVEAFDLARAVARVLPEVNDEESFWAGFTFVIDVDSVPSGAKVWRQKADAPRDEWEFLGETPLKDVRFAAWVGSRVRFELEGHHSVTVLQEALMGPDMPYGSNAYNPAILEPLDQAPADMVRLPGFTRELVEFSPYYMDRYEVTNRDYAKFIAAGGYKLPQYWTEPFMRDGQEVAFEDAVAEFVDRTGRPGPASWEGSAWPSGQGEFPVSGISWYEAAAYANFTGKILPTVAHHQMALRMYSVNSGTIALRSNFGMGGPRAVGEGRALNTFGLYDNVGNVREWCWNEMRDGNRCSFGTSWADIPYMAESATPKSPWDRSPEHGMRLARSMDSEEKLARLREPAQEAQARDFSKETPASDAEYELIKRFYAYDPLPLNAETVESVDAELWRRERVEFDLPSGERGAAYLLIPTQRQPPFATVIFWPGSDMLNRRSVDEATIDYMDFLVKSGYLVAWPVFRGTLDRDNPDDPITSGNQAGGYDTFASTYYRDLLANWIKELSRTIDYLDSRPDLYNGWLGFYGVSWGGFKGPIPLALEADRFDAAVLAVAGLSAYVDYLPESDAFNFVTRVQAPTLMINGEYDAIAQRDTEGQPLYDWLGTDPEHKKMYLAPTSHFMPREVLIRETLDWFDQYLGDNN
jgi:formylglycine-generating enzyme required for sulfatase activity/dienelactone hydrolase